jgi:hypothetical protein
LRQEAVMYEPQAGGGLKPLGVEYNESRIVVVV